LPHPPTDVEDQTWTMETYLETLQKLKQALGEDIIAMGNSHTYHWNRGTWYGHSSWDDVAVKPTMDHELFIKGNQFWQDLKHKHRLLPDAAASEAVGGIGKGFESGKVAMYYTCCPHNVLRNAQASGVEAGLATLPFSGWDTNGNTLFPGKNISGRVWPHNMHVAKEIPTEEQEAAWTFFMWLAKDPANGGLMAPSNQHIVAPYLDTAYSDVAQRDFETITGVDSVASSAPLQNALTEYPSFCGMLKYEEYSDAWNTIKDDWTKHEANEMSSGDFSRRAQEVFTNAGLGTNTL
jgi:ABC-type glycerol-3-phosphate transport system substrate-binding protein